jgi:hypothetical protein
MARPLKDKTQRRQCKMSSTKKLTCKGTLRQVFIRVYRLEIVNFLRTFSHVIFVIWTLHCCPSLLLSGATLSLSPLLEWISILHTRIHTVCKGGGYGALGLSQIKTCRKGSLQVKFSRWRRFALPSIRLIFLRARLCLAVHMVKPSNQDAVHSWT